MTWPPKPYLQELRGESGLFPGPVIDGGRRLWDWNPNSRDQAIQRWYAGPWFEMVDPCQCGRPCPGPYHGKCSICGKGFWTCHRLCNEDRGHVKGCPYFIPSTKHRPNRRPKPERASRRKSHWIKVKARR